MSARGLEAIPENRREVVAEALAAVCGPRLDHLQPISGGASGALICRVDAGGRPWLLRLEAIDAPGPRDIPRAYACMRAASDAGIAPRLHLADADKGVAVMEFIHSRPFADFAGGEPALVPALGALARRVHAIEPPFPSPRADYPTLVDFMMGAVRRTGAFREGLLDPHAEGLARVRSAYRFEGPAVSCHNDPNRMNVLFDGERLWLVDWELSFRNDPLIDVGILADNFAPTSPAAEALLASWLGGEPDRALRTRYALARQLSRAFYACALLSIAGASPSGPDDLSAPTPEEFTKALAAGDLKVGSPELLRTLGKMQLASFLAGLNAPEVREALAEAGGC